MKVIDRVNFIYAAVVTALSAALGKYWYLFAAFAILNIADYITGIVKARMTNEDNSVKGLNGIIKKLGYWVVIAIAFFVSRAFIGIGTDIGYDLGMTIFIGWFTLITFIINEIRSVLENLSAIGVELPPWLVKGLKVAADKINSAAGGNDDENG